jgi:hypothetical protein
MVPVPILLGFNPDGSFRTRKPSLSGFYETAGVVKVFVFAFVFSFLAFLLLFFVLCSLFVFWIHLGLLYALD